MIAESLGEVTTEKSSFEKTTIQEEDKDTPTVSTPPSNQVIIFNDADELESGTSENEAKRGYWNPEEERSVINALIDQVLILRSKIDDAFSQTNPVQYMKSKLPSRKFPFGDTSKSNSPKRRRTTNSISPQFPSIFNHNSTQQNDPNQNSQRNEASASAAASSSSTSGASAEIDARLLLDVFFSSNISWSFISRVVRSRGSNQCRNHW